MKFMEFWDLQRELFNLSNIQHEIIGYSVLGRPIYMFHAGRGQGKRIFIDGGVHAREYAGSLAIFKLIKFLNENPPEQDIYIVPVVNPDGIALVLNGLSSIINPSKKEQLRKINGNEDFSCWKANANAVDINVNFDAGWGSGVQNVFSPSAENFVGCEPNSEPETRAIIKALVRVKPDMAFSIHTKGEIVYYGFQELSKDRIEKDREIAEKVADSLGYYPVQSIGSAGGVQDFISQNFSIPAVTIEMGENSLSHPIGKEKEEEFFNKLKNLIEDLGGLFESLGVFWF